MSTEQNKNIIRRVFKEGIGERKFQVFDELIAENFINHGMPNAQPGPKGMRDTVQQFMSAFPDMQIVNQEFIAEGDLVTTRGYMTGTHNGSFMGIGATAKKIQMDYIDIWKVKDGKCTENWVQMDLAGLMRQIDSKQYAL